MNLSPLTQDKLNHAILWSVVREEYDGFIDAPSVRAHLLNIGTEQQIRAGMKRLVECGFIEEGSAPDQEHFEPTHIGVEKIESLEPLKSSFVGPLSLHGPAWLRSQSARDAKLLSTIKPSGAPIAPSPPSPSSPAPVSVHTTVSPIFNNNVGGTESDDGGLARSGVRAGWTAVWVAILIAIVLGVITAWAGGKL